MKSSQIIHSHWHLLRGVLAAAFAVGFAFSSQAVTVKWGLASSILSPYQEGSAVPALTAVYLIDNDVVSKSSFLRKLGQQTSDEGLETVFWDLLYTENAVLGNAFTCTDGTIRGMNCANVELENGQGVYVVAFAMDPLKYTEYILAGNLVEYSYTAGQTYWYSDDPMGDGTVMDHSYSNRIGLGASGWNAVVPEPTTGLLFASGLSLLAIRRRRGAPSATKA